MDRFVLYSSVVLLQAVHNWKDVNPPPEKFPSGAENPDGLTYADLMTQYHERVEKAKVSTRVL